MKLNSEEELIQAMLKGDLKAYEILIGQYEKKIYALCLHLLKDTEEAYDAAQEVCIKIWKQIGTFKGQAKLSTWIYRMTTNQCLDILRKNKRKGQELSLFLDEETGEEEKLTDQTAIWQDVSSHIEQKELGEVIRQGIGELKEDYQVVIVLRDIEQRSYEEIANILEISLGTVKSRLSRARSALRKILEQNKEPYRSFFRHNNK
ncbi:MAG: sigma-70 family RNA polymerase sigma factor [Candidatus Cellulosilyticum pullistercoris]|uniref:Sigma-70 family RNA polymerase sigma factor n=1 Tax=Candidatus Cellulosilyticum pullistercoris TaxID=2838521 RepID=A0A9E2KCC2_9FIRM|nr:sigma-70 family RNA polymerase sigma factor [Candidatus Cellulosilyticum pullistercoris]